MADLPEKNETDAPKPFFSKALDIAAWPISVAIGWWWGNDSARNSLYDTLKHTDKFDKPVRKAHWKNVNSLVNDGLESVEKGIVSSADIIKPLAHEHNVFDQKSMGYLQKLGFNNTLDYIRGINKNEARKAIMTGIGAGGVALGVITMLANHEGLQQLFSRKRKNDGQDISK